MLSVPGSPHRQPRDVRRREEPDVATRDHERVGQALETAELAGEEVGAQGQQLRRRACRARASIAGGARLRLAREVAMTLVEASADALAPCREGRPDDRSAWWHGE